jgi:hypothetical protein
VADDQLFGGRVLVAMSHQALHIGQLHDGLDFAAAATQGANAAGLPAEHHTRIILTRAGDVVRAIPSRRQRRPLVGELRELVASQESHAP